MPFVFFQELEASAMQTFTYRIQSQRISSNYSQFDNSVASQYYQSRAPGFDYVHWKPYGVIRYERNTRRDGRRDIGWSFSQDAGQREYEQQARALAPYVHSVVESGCQGAEENRWEALTQPVDTNWRPLGSRAGSGDLLSSRGGSQHRI